MPLRNLLILSFSAIFSLVCYNTAVRSRYASTISEALSIINDNYLERVDDRELFEGAMNGMVEKLDQYSKYIPPSKLPQFQEPLDQEFGGIGVVIEVSEEDHTITVVSPMAGTPADRAGIRAGDIIVAIDGKVVAETPTSEAFGLMRGKPGSEVKLLVLHEGDSKPTQIVVRREIIPVQSVKGDWHRADGTWDFALEEHPRIGYVRLNTFGDRTQQELEDVLEYQGDEFDGLIIDLRDNAGGYLTTAVAVCDMFIDEGVIVSTRGRDNKLRSEYRATKSATKFAADKPMVVLVNHYSASAAEIVAACLQDHKRAVVVGSRTWGKGTVQNIVQLEGGASALKLTTGSYWRPSNQKIHRLRDAPETDDWGVRPNEGMEVKLDDQAAQRLARWRRARDFPQSKPAGDDLPPPATGDGENGDGENGDEENPAEEDPADSAANEESAQNDTPFDPQLERAVEYIQSELPAK